MTRYNRIKWYLTALFFTGCITLTTVLQSCSDGSEKNQETSEPMLAQPNMDSLNQAELAFLQKGLNIIAPSQKALGSQLKKALKSGGVAHALQYCNTAAYPIMDSLSQAYNVEIRRTTLKDRNPKDQPLPHERDMLEAFTARYHASESMDPILRNLPEGKTGFYSPIMTQTMCLQCHGNPGTDIAQSDLNLINELYPNDKATGYKEGQLRGMWSVTFSEKITP